MAKQNPKSTASQPRVSIVGWCAQSMCVPVAVLNESFLSDAFAGRVGQTPPFKGQAHAAPALCKTTLLLHRGLEWDQASFAGHHLPKM
jgi:hypothetical protein